MHIKYNRIWASLSISQQRHFGLVKRHSYSDKTPKNMHPGIIYDRGITDWMRVTGPVCGLDCSILVLCVLHVAGPDPHAMFSTHWPHSGVHSACGIQVWHRHTLHGTAPWFQHSLIQTSPGTSAEGWSSAGATCTLDPTPYAVCSTCSIIQQLQRIQQVCQTGSMSHMQHVRLVQDTGVGSYVSIGQIWLVDLV